MAAKQRPIEIEYLAKVTEYLRNVEKVEVSTEQVEAALVGTSNSAQDLERKLSRAMRDAAKDTEVLERAIKDLPKATDDAADSADKDFHRMGDSARDAGKDMGGEFRQSLGESLSSGGGDLSESLSETLGEAVGNAPLPLAAVGALALALWGHFKEESEKHKQSVSDIFDLTDLITGEIDKFGKVQQALTAYGGTFDQGVTKAKKQADLLGVSFEQLAEVLTGEINVSTNETLEALEGQRKVAGQLLVQGKISSSQNEDIVQAQDEILLKIKAQRAATKEAGDATAVMRDYMIDAGHAADPLLAKLQQASAIAKDPGNWKIPVDFYATSPLGQSLISGKNYSPGHVAIAQQQMRDASKSNVAK